MGRHRMRLGVPQSDYNVNRNILGSVPPWMSVHRPVDPFRVITALRYRTTGEFRHSEGFRFREPYFPRVHLLHFFNTIADTLTPWVCTFEHCLPRWDKPGGGIQDADYLHGAALMAGSACRRLIAISDASRNVAAVEWHARLTASLTDALTKKVEILLPPQRVICEVDEKPPLDRPLISFVGSEFYRKGGLEALAALDRLRQRGIRNWRAVFVGRLESHGDYASHTSPASRDAAVHLLSRLADHVQHHERLAGREVLGLLRASSYCLLPTFADTFGYSALEAMACGAVVIASNVRALPEVIDDETGYLVKLPLDDNRDAHRLPQFDRVKADMVDQLEAILSSAILSSDSQRIAMARAATARLRRCHDPAAHRLATERIYRQALA